MEGFEKVLAVDKDYRASPPMLQQNSNQGVTSPVKPTTPSNRPGLAPAFSASAIPPASPRPHPLRTQSLAPSSTTSNRDPRTSPRSPQAILQNQIPPPDNTVPAGQKKGRFSMDFITSALWRGSSAAAQASGTTGAPAASGASTSTGPSSSPNPPPLPGFKPMMLNAAARRMSTDEDEEDQKTRARLQSEMKLLGYANHGSPVLHAGLGASPSNNAQPIQRNRSPSQRLSVGSATSNLLSPQPPSLPPKDDYRELEGNDSNGSKRISGSAEIGSSASPSGGGSVKLSGHRKRPSAGNKETATGEQPSGLQSIGLGLSYSKDSVSTWSSRSPGTSHQGA